MFGMGGSEIIVILIVALLFLGPDKLPSAAKSISKGIRDIKKQSRALQQQIENDEQIGGAIRDLKSALRGDEAPPPRRLPPRPRELPDGAPTIHPQLAGETGEAAAPETDGLEATDATDPPAPQVRLPASAGEPDASTPPRSDDEDELAAMIKPAAGTIAKGS